MQWRERRGKLNRLGLGVGIGYLLGTISAADIVVRRVAAPDLRTQGTGNPGAANAMNSKLPIRIRFLINSLRSLLTHFGARVRGWR